jgi:hypothetical protein
VRVLPVQSGTVAFYIKDRIAGEKYMQLSFKGKL